MTYQTYTKGFSFELSSIETLATEDSKFNRVGYDFDQWIDKDGRKYNDRSNVVFDEEITHLSATWKIHEWQVWFDEQNEKGTINVIATDSNGNAKPVSPGDKVEYNSKLKITLTPNDGYEIQTIQIGNVQLTEISDKIYECNVPDEDVEIVVTWNDTEGTVWFHPNY